MRVLFFPLLFSCALSMIAQPWSGIIDTTRATDWSLAGVDGGIPSATWANCDNTNCNAIAPGGAGTVSASTINTAISGAQVGGVSCSASLPCVVRLRSGTFNSISSGIRIDRSNVVLRGQGADATFLNFTGTTQCPHIGDRSVVVGICTGNNGQHSANWTAGFTQGTTVITVANTTSMVDGQPVFLFQTDDTSDGYPAAGDIVVCAAEASFCSSAGNLNAFDPAGSSFSQGSGYKIVSHTSTTVTLDHGIIMPNYRTGRSATAIWYDSDVFLQNAGIESLSLDYSAVGASINGVMCLYCFNVWEHGVRSVTDDDNNNKPHHMAFYLSYRCTAQSNYWFGPELLSGGIDQYSMSVYWCFNCLYQNNINQQRQAGLVTASAMTGSVWAYNFTPGRPDPGVVEHAAGEMMNLYEGNVSLGHYTDDDHGSHHFETIFRNAFVGRRYAASPFGSVQDMVQIQARGRFYNVIGNVMGDSYITTYETTLAQSNVSVFNLGWQGNASGAGNPTSDTNVKRTLLRWGNWDSVTNATRWCGNSSNTGWSTTCSSTTEVPSAITNFPNSIPATETLPSSFYLSSRPSWFRSVAYPPIGPDVSSGNISSMGGHANVNPAADCYLNVMSGPADGSGSALTFNAATCYPASSSAAAMTRSGKVTRTGK